MLMQEFGKIDPLCLEVLVFWLYDNLSVHDLFVVFMKFINLPLQITLSFWYRCSAQQSGDLDSSSEALDGILGFGQSNSSMISQLAAAGKVRKVFAHCLDTVKGGGIFAIGNVVQPKVKTTPLIPNMYVMLEQPSY